MFVLITTILMGVDNFYPLFFPIKDPSTSNYQIVKFNHLLTRLQLLVHVSLFFKAAILNSDYKYLICHFVNFGNFLSFL
jgi:hypothetical protein